MKNILSSKQYLTFLSAGILITTSWLYADEWSPNETQKQRIEIEKAQKKQEVMEIKGSRALPPRIVPPADVKPPKEFSIPEIPKPITRKRLGPPDEVHLADLERKYSEGKITKTEYDLEKDSLVRDANIEF